MTVCDNETKVAHDCMWQWDKQCTAKKHNTNNESYIYYRRTCQENTWIKILLGTCTTELPTPTAYVKRRQLIEKVALALGFYINIALCITLLPNLSILSW